MNLIKDILNFLFKFQYAQKKPRIFKGWVIGTYLFGGWLWGNFFSWGKFPIHFHDWAEVNIGRLAYLRDAILKGALPLHAAGTAHLRNGTDQILSVPDLVISPQVILMRWMDIEMFVFINTLFLYTIAFIGLLWILRRHKLSPIIFSTLVFLFNFNGHIISHLGIGHITWWSYFLFPFLYIQIIRLLEDRDHSWKWVFQTSILLFLIFLQGGYHHYVWSLMFLGVLALVAWKHTWVIFKVLIFSNLLSMIRLLPPAQLVNNFEPEFLSGYPKLSNVFSAFLFERAPQDSLPFLNFDSNLGYWEFDLFIGKFGALIIFFGFLLWLISLRKNQPVSYILIPMIVLSVLSIGNIYEPFTRIPFPLIAGERVSSRFIIIPFLFAVIFSLTSLQDWLNKINKPLILYPVFLIMNFFILFDISKHVFLWKIENIFPHFPYTPVDKTLKAISNHADPTYTTFLIIGAIVTLISITVLYILTRHESKKNLSP